MSRRLSFLDKPIDFWVSRWDCPMSYSKEKTETVWVGPRSNEMLFIITNESSWMLLIINAAINYQSIEAAELKRNTKRHKHYINLSQYLPSNLLMAVARTVSRKASTLLLF